MFSTAVLERLDTASVITGHSMLCPYPEIESPIIPEKDAPRGRRYWMFAVVWISTFTVSATWSRNVLGSLIPHFT
jgi:hypothetical protein